MLDYLIFGGIVNNIGYFVVFVVMFFLGVFVVFF